MSIILTLCRKKKVKGEFDYVKFRSNPGPSYFRDLDPDLLFSQRSDLVPGFFLSKVVSGYASLPRTLKPNINKT